MFKLFTAGTTPVEQRISESPALSALLFGSLACLLFHPFFLGRFALGGTDILLNHYPNLLFGYREFQQFGTFSLWNRYIFAGTDFATSIHAHYLNPVYWPLLLFPEKYIFHALTAGFMVMSAMTGWFWSRIATRLGVLATGSLMVGVVAQAGMFFWFAMTTMIAVPMFLCASIAIYLVVTHAARTSLANYCMLSIVLGLLIVTPHPAYILGFMLPVAVVFLVLTYPGWRYQPWRGFPPIFAAACGTALLLAAYRLAPVGAAIVGEGASIGGGAGFPSPFHFPYFWLSAFNPLAFGITVSDAQEFSRLLDFASGRHTQAHNALYFGIAPLIVVYIAVRASGSAKTLWLAAAYVVLQLSYLYTFQPITDVAYLILYPLGHEGLFRPATTIAFMFLLIHCLKEFSSRPTVGIKQAIRECIVIAGVVIASSLALYGKSLHAYPEFVSRFGAGFFMNSLRLGILASLITAVLLARLSLPKFASLQFGMLGVLSGGVVVVTVSVFAMVAGLLPGDNMVMAALNNEVTAILVCVAVMFAAGYGPSRMRQWVIPACCIAVVLLFLLPMPVAPGGHDLRSSVWVAMTGWGGFIALTAVTITLLARFANKGIDAGMAMKLLLVLTVADLVVAFDNYSYVNVPATPFIKRFDDIYPPTRLAARRSDLTEAGGLRNLLIDPELRLTPGQPAANWNFGGNGMALCASPAGTFAMAHGNALRVCYPGVDGGGNFYQDVDPEEAIRQAAMGVWVRAEPGMDVALFLTSPSSNIGGVVTRLKGDGKWHWMVAVLEAKEPFKVVRPHINMAKSGSAEIYAPRLVPGTVVRPAARPTDGHEIVEDLPLEINLASFRVNHVDPINGFASGDRMTNLAIVAGTPTYAGVDSDLPQDFVDFLKVFRESDPGWLQRAGLYSSIKDERFLDLLGVAYDVGDSGDVITRPNAIPRFAAFPDYEIKDNQGALLQRLKAKDFDPAKTVILQGAPDASRVRTDDGRFQHLAYATPGADRLSLKITAETPRLILFNDRFSPHWQADWNGKPLQIIRANGIFMAVALPDGAGELNFVFRPRVFVILATIAAITALLLLLLGTAAVFRPRFLRAPSPLAAPS